MAKNYENISTLQIMWYNQLMGKIDEVKEILTTLRVGLSIIVGLLVVIVGSTINLERKGDTGIYFYLGLVSTLVLVVVFLKIVKHIIKFTRKIKDL